MNPQDPSQAPQPDNNPLSVMQPGEQIICEIRRHPIGMFGIYAASGGVLVVLAILAFLVAPSMLSSDNRTQVLAATGVAFVIITAVVLAFVFIANKVYWGNHWVVTSDSITQITQTSLFSKQSSQLSLGNLEDVTAEQNGILPQLFKFGIIKAETAGERSKFVFLFCPNPNYYAQKILSAREVFEQVHHGGKQEPSPAVVPGPPANPNPMPEAPAGQDAQYQIGQTPPNFSEPPVSSQPLAYPGQPPAGPAASYPPTDNYPGMPDTGTDGTNNPS